MRLWDEAPGAPRDETRREYETVGFVLSGRAELVIEGQVVQLEPGDSWVAPSGAVHHYRILEPFRAVEATSPARVRGRDERPSHQTTPDPQPLPTRRGEGA